MNLVTTLAVILIAAAIFTVLSRVFKQPLILGYIVAGFLVGPNLGLVPDLSMEVVHQWSEIGIIFLLFALGLEFSFKKLIKVGSSALITACMKCFGMFFVGLLLGSAMGWTTIESIFVGGLLSMSSTTIIIKAYDEMGLKSRPHSTLLFGSLVFEDLIAVLLMVLLSTIAVTQSFDGGAMMSALLKLGFFMILWFLVGIFAVPSLLKWAHKYMNDEICLITAIGLCFLMVWLAELVGFSSALGAFVMGSILSETVEGERIEHSIGNIKDLFGAIFFVSVGMMVDPVVIGQYWLPIVIITLAFMLGILIFSTSGALLTGQGLKNAVHVGLSLTVLGEFAFIIAGLGCDMGVMRSFFYPVVVTVSVITSFTAPYVIKAADPFSDWLVRVLPAKVVEKLSPSADAHKANSATAENEWKIFLKNYFLRILLFGVLIAAVMLGAESFLGNWVANLLPHASTNTQGWVATIITLVVALPFLYGFVMNSAVQKSATEKLIRERRHNRYLLQALSVARGLGAAIFAMLIFVIFVDPNGFTLLAVLAVSLVMLFIVRKSTRRFTLIEDRFMENFNEKERMERAAMPVTTSLQDKLNAYDVHIDSVEISPNFAFVGKPLREMPFRHLAGVNIVELMRGERYIRIPRGDELIFPHDILLAVGTTEQLAAFAKIVEENTSADEAHRHADFGVHTIDLEESSPFAGKTLRESGLRASGCLVVSILRGEELITNPKPDERLEVGDHLWVAGEKSSLDFLGL